MFIYKEEYKYPIYVLLNVTDDCNLQCRYCFVEQHPHYMSLETAKKIADWVYENFQQRKKLNLLKYIEERPSLYFFGGEPMLCYDSIIVPIVNYCKEKYSDCNFIYGITTNGTLLNKERIDFFRKNNFSILLSIDGAKETQDYNRPCKNCNLSSFDLLEKNIPYLLQNFPNVCFRATIYAPTVEHLFENYLYAEKMGFKKCAFIEDFRHEAGWTQEKLDIYHEQMSYIYAYRLKQIINNEFILDYQKFATWFKLMLSVYNEPDKIYKNSTLDRCGLGTTGCSVGWDGNIYGCQEQDSKNINSFFLIGNIFNGRINQQEHLRLLKFYYDEQEKDKILPEKCENCLLKKVCQSSFSICPSTTYDEYKDMSSISELSCFVRRTYIENSIVYLNILSQFKSPQEIKKLFNLEDEGEEET